MKKLFFLHYERNGINSCTLKNQSSFPPHLNAWYMLNNLPDTCCVSDGFWVWSICHPTNISTVSWMETKRIVLRSNCYFSCDHFGLRNPRKSICVVPMWHYTNLERERAGQENGTLRPRENVFSLNILRY